MLDLFSGIGGFSLGLERAGMRTVAFCEAERYCRMVLRAHWPKVPIYERIETLTAARLARDGIEPPELICGGFPCQDISCAGAGAGLDGARSGLWREFARLIGECRPAWVIIENVAQLRSRGLDRILADLAALGFDAEWHCIPAAPFGAPHLRDRVWIVAYADRERLRLAEQRRAGRRQHVQDGGLTEPVEHGAARAVANAARIGREERSVKSEIRTGFDECAQLAGGSTSLADSHGGRCALGRHAQHGIQRGAAGIEPDGCGAGRWGYGPIIAGAIEGGWEPEPDVGRVAHGVPARVDRLAALGNALIPQIPEFLGRAIMRSAR